MTDHDDSLWGLSLVQEWLSGNKDRCLNVHYKDHENGDLIYYVQATSTLPAENGISGHGQDPVLFDAMCDAIVDFNRQNSGGI